MEMLLFASFFTLVVWLTVGSINYLNFLQAVADIHSRHDALLKLEAMSEDMDFRIKNYIPRARIEADGGPLLEIHKERQKDPKKFRRENLPRFLLLGPVWYFL